MARDLRFTANDGAIVELRAEGDHVFSRGQDTPPGAQELRRLNDGFAKAAGPLAQSGHHQISERMPAQSAATSKPMLEQIAERAVSFRERNKTIAEITDSRNPERFAQGAARSAIVGYADNSGH